SVDLDLVLGSAVVHVGLPDDPVAVVVQVQLSDLAVPDGENLPGRRAEVEFGTLHLATILCLVLSVALLGAWSGKDLLSVLGDVDLMLDSTGCGDLHLPDRAASLGVDRDHGSTTDLLQRGLAGCQQAPVTTRGGALFSGVARSVGGRGRLRGRLFRR